MVQNMKTLYISDLDGTLLQSSQCTSDFTNETINQLVRDGMLFSYATARSFITASKVTKGLNAEIPVITYTGSMIINNKDGSVMLDNYFGEEVHGIIDDLLQHDIYPIVYAMVDGQEKMSFVASKMSRGVQDFVDSRQNDPRIRPAESVDALHNGTAFYITCIDEKGKLTELYKKYQNQFHCIFQVDLYSKEQWLEILPKCVSKAHAIKQLMEYYKCNHLVVFGDGKNDIDMFEMADEAYAVANAVPELKKIATSVIGGNNKDGVAKFLVERFNKLKM